VAINKEELRELCAKLDALRLSVAQRQLLNEIVKAAWTTVKQGESLDAQFDGSFEPGEARAIMTGEERFKLGIRDVQHP
jgi:hypothetical protein